MSTKKDRMYERIHAHGLKLLAIFPGATEKEPIALAKRAFALERRAHQIQVEDCNGNPSCKTEAEYEAWKLTLDKRSDLVRGAFKRLFGVRLEKPFFMNGDPRGYCLKVKSEYVVFTNMDIPRDWGGYGLIAPDLTED
jgi:hypothetical protein